jgi:hypothetical protein
MSSMRFSTGGEEEVPPGRILMEKDGVLATRRTTPPVREGGGPSTRRVLDVGDRTTCTIVFRNCEPVSRDGLLWGGGVFSEGGVSVRAMEHGIVAPFPVRAILDLAGQWRIMGFTRYLISQVVLFCIRQYYGH